MSRAPNARHRLSPEVNPIVYVRNLPFRITGEELYDIFGKHGIIRTIRRGISERTKGTAFVVYHDVLDAKAAVDNLNGFNVAGRYLVCLYFQPRGEAFGGESDDPRERKIQLQKRKRDLGFS